MARGFVLLVSAALLGLVWLGTSRSSRVQKPTGGIVGAILDPSQTTIPHASVTVTGENGRWYATVLTDGFGLYSIRDLAPGRYSLRIEAQGYAAKDVADILVVSGAVARGTVTLQFADGGGKQ
jgi:hypothetical protein